MKCPTSKAELDAAVEHYREIDVMFRPRDRKAAPMSDELLDAVLSLDHLRDRWERMTDVQRYLALLVLKDAADQALGSTFSEN